ncbi:MAG: MerR family transcriptional regulator [Candidatus Limnocylindria bacterium]
MSLMTPSDLLPIGAFARRSRLSLKALRLYDELGLLPPARVDPETGYRFYEAGQVERARLIGLLRRLDMPLARIGRVLELEGARAAREVAAFWGEVEASAAVKRRLVAYLERHLSGRGEPMYDVVTRDVPAQDILSLTRSLTVKDLETFIIDGTRELMKQVAAAGATLGPASFVIYHGAVTEDSDGPVEVCVPFTGTVTAAGEAIRRSEPAHREAFTTITRAQTQFPGILDAYGAVEVWIERRGAQMTGSPREVYFNSDPDPEPDRPFCDIAFPIG